MKSLPWQKKKLIATAIRNSDLPTNFAIKAIEPGSFDFLVISNSQPFPLDALVSHLLSVISNIFPLFRTIFSFPLRHSAVIVKSSAHCIAKLILIPLDTSPSYCCLYSFSHRLNESKNKFCCSKENITTITVHLQTQWVVRYPDWPLQWN